MHPRRIAAFLCLLAIVALRVEPQLLRLPFMNRQPISAALTRVPDRAWPEFPRFLEAVRAQTRPGDSIAVIVPGMKWDEGYSYAYYRASYFLAGRDVLPLVTADGRTHPENFRAARYIAVWRGDRGVLLRR